MKRFQLGVCEWSVRARGRAFVEMAARQNLDCIQIGVGVETFLGNGLADPKRVDEYLATASELGVAVDSVCPQFVDDYSFTKPRGAEDEEIAVTITNRALDLIPTFGCGYFLLPVLCRNTVDDAPSFHRAVSYIRTFAEKAAAVGAETYLEVNLGAAQIYNLLDAVDRDDVKIFFDSQNLYGFNGTAMAPYFTELMAHELVGGIHVKDGNGMSLSGSLLGEGTSGFWKTAKAIVRSSYRGSILTESVYANPGVACLGTEEELLARDAAVMRTAFPE